MRAASCGVADLAAALSTEALRGTDTAFDPRLHALRAHPGQRASAANLWSLMRGSAIRESHRAGDVRVQDPYSVRCAPQVHGAVRDVLADVETKVAVEMNAVTDNPLVFPGDGDDGAILSGGNFHGQPMAFAADFLAIALAELASIGERRIEKLTNTAFSGLPPFLARDAGLNSGFMMAQVTAAALVAENKVACHPASIDSIPTSADKEDHVSMGMGAALKLRTVVENVRRVLAIELVAAAQGIDLLRPLRSSERLEEAHRLVRERIEFREDDPGDGRRPGARHRACRRARSAPRRPRLIAGELRNAVPTRRTRRVAASVPSPATGNGHTPACEAVGLRPTAGGTPAHPGGACAAADDRSGLSALPGARPPARLRGAHPRSPETPSAVAFVPRHARRSIAGTATSPKRITPPARSSRCVRCSPSAVGTGRIREREPRVNDRPDRAGCQQWPHVRVQRLRNGRLLLDGAGASVEPVTVRRRSMMGSTLSRSTFGPCCTAMITSRPSTREALQVPREVVAGDHVEHHVDPAPAGQRVDTLHEVLFAVVDRRVGSEREAGFALRLRPRGDVDGRAERFASWIAVVRCRSNLRAPGAIRPRRGGRGRRRWSTP